MFFAWFWFLTSFWFSASNSFPKPSLLFFENLHLFQNHLPLFWKKQNWNEIVGKTIWRGGVKIKTIVDTPTGILSWRNPLLHYHHQNISIYLKLFTVTGSIYDISNLSINKKKLKIEFLFAKWPNSKNSPYKFSPLKRYSRQLFSPIV